MMMMVGWFDCFGFYRLSVSLFWGGRVVRRCWVNFQCRGNSRIIVGQRPIALAVGTGGGCLDFLVSRLSFLFSFSLSGGRPNID